MVYELVEGNLIPTGTIKALKDFAIGEIFMCPEYGVEGLTYIPYKVTGRTIVNNSILIQSERVML
jgi:hypothetical protein